MENHPDALARKEQLEYHRIAEYIRKMPEPRQYIKINKLSLNAILPTQSNPTDAGWDLYSTQDTFIPSGGRGLISTGIAMAIPSGYVGLIWPRSGLATKKGVDVFAGVVDAGYRGEVKVCLYNSSADELKVEAGDRIAQMLFQKIGNFTLAEAVQLDDTSRSAGGFGSTGI